MQRDMKLKTCCYVSLCTAKVFESKEAQCLGLTEWHRHTMTIRCRLDHDSSRTLTFPTISSPSPPSIAVCS